jgi:hypothetical protein
MERLEQQTEVAVAVAVLVDHLLVQEHRATEPLEVLEL